MKKKIRLDNFFNKNIISLVQVQKAENGEAYNISAPICQRKEHDYRTIIMKITTNIDLSKIKIIIESNF